MKKSQLRVMMVSAAIPLIAAATSGSTPHHTEPFGNIVPSKHGPSTALATNLSCDAPPSPGTPHKNQIKAVAEDADITIYGIMAQDKSYNPPRICSFSAFGDINMVDLIVPVDNNDYSMTLTRGGFYTPDGSYYVLGSNKIVQYDTENWAAGVKSETAIDLTNTGQPYGVTYDVTTGNVYGCFMRQNMMWPQKYMFASLDIATGKVTKIADLPGDDKGKAYGVASDGKGNIYMILKYDSKNQTNFYPALYKIDKTSGEITYIGNTGVNLQTAYSAAAIDHKTGRMFWTVDATYNSGILYEVNLETAECTQLRTMPNGEQFASIAIPYTLVPASAPALLTDATINFTDGEGNATLSFTIPATTYDGGELTGNVDYTIACGEQQLGKGSANPGEKIERAINIETRGEVTVTVTLTGSDGISESSNEIKTFSGHDIPESPANVMANAKGNVINLNWEAPTKGIHGGYISTTDVTYKVTLQPGNIVIAEAAMGTSLTHTAAFEQPTSIYAEVTPTCSNITGPATHSSRFIAGNAFITPWNESFSNAATMELFTVIDVDSDNATWSRYSGEGDDYAFCDYSTENNKNDWLITPAITIEAGHYYTLSFKASSLMVKAFPEILEVKLGLEPTVESMTQTILDAEQIDNKESWSWFDYSITVTVEKTGDYHIGFHALSPANQFKLGIDEITIEGAAMDAPQPVSEVTAIAAPWGVHNATLKFRTPSASNKGAELTSLTSVEVYVNNRLQKTIAAPAVNSIQTLALETVEGMNSIDIYAFNNNGRSIATHTTVYTGADSPGVPENFIGKAVDNTVTLTWDSPTGAHGGVIDTEKINYSIGRYVNGGKIEVLSLSLGNACSYTEECEFTEQTPVVYVLSATNDLGSSPISAVSNCVIVGGDAYALPFAETFPSGFSTYPIWQNQTVDQSGTGTWRMWNIEYDSGVQPQDSDLGAVCFQPDAAGDKTRLFSGKINLSNARHPVLEFWYRGNGSAGQKIIIEGNADYQNWDVLTEIVLDENSDAWTQVKLPLNRYNFVSAFQIAFVGIAANTQPIYVDNISIREVYTNDLGISLSSRRNHYYGNDSELTATITNFGEKPADRYTIEFYANGDQIACVEKENLEVDATEIVTTEYSLDLGSEDTTLLEVYVKYAADENKTNDRAEFTTVNHLPLYPEPRNLQASTASYMATMTWQKPEPWVEPEAKPITEDFESYEPFLTDEFGEWTTIDIDGDEGTFGLIGMHFPGREAAKSWQIFNLWALGIEMADDEVTWRPSSGHQFLVAFADKDRKNDDWLISPRLSGHEQTITFMTRSLNTFWYGEESFEVYTSSTGKALEDFQLMCSGTAPGEWTENVIDLPEGTNYFAIKCTSEGYKFALGLDDITYTPGTGMPTDIELTGYNIYKNGKKVNDAPVSETSYATEAGPSDSLSVTAVYKTGESRYSNVIIPSGIHEINLTDNDINIRVEDRTIYMSGLNGKHAGIYGIDGICHFRSDGHTDKASATVPPGLYLIASGSKTIKISVK